MRSREAWLAGFAAVLGISEEACRRETAPQAHEVASATASATASAPVVAQVAPSETASAETVPSATASAAPSASASVAPIVMTPQDITHTICGARPQNIVPFNASCGAIGMPTTLGVGSGIGPHNNACGATVNPSRTTSAPQAVIAVNIVNGAPGDDRVAASLRPRFRACGNQALAQDPTQQGKLVVSAAIAANGDVNAVTIDSNSGLSASSAQCMLRAVRNASFPTGTARKIQIVIVQTKQSP
jgi:hypothetical protein